MMISRVLRAIVLFAVGIWAGFLIQHFSAAFTVGDPGGFHVALAAGRDEPVAVHFLPDPNAEGLSADMPAPDPAPPLPFHIRLLDVEPPAPPLDAPVILSVREGAQEDRLVLRPGQEAMLGGEHYFVGAATPWTGLIASPQGVPMAHMAVMRDDSDDAYNIFLYEGQWTTLWNGARAILRRHGSQDEANRAAVATSLGLEHARWGVVERDAVHWLNTFAPGAGLELDDGRQVVLLGLADGDNVLRVAIAGPDGAEERRVRANVADAGPLLRFEHPGRLDTALTLHAWTGDGAFAALFRNGERVVQRHLAVGERWRPPGLEYALSLSGISAQAVPAYPRASGPMGVVLESDARRLFVGELQWEQVGDVSVRFLGLETEGPWHYVIAVSDGTGREHMTARVAVGAEHPLQVNGWDIVATAPSGVDGAIAELLILPRAVPRWRATGRLALLALLGAAMAGVAAFLTQEKATGDGGR